MLDWNTVANQFILLLTGAILQGAQVITLLVVIVIFSLVVYTIVFQIYKWLLEAVTLVY